MSILSHTGGAHFGHSWLVDVLLFVFQVPSINRGASFDGYTNSGNSYGDGNHSSGTVGIAVGLDSCNTNGNSNFNDQLTSSLADINSAFPNSYLAAKVRSGQLGVASSATASSNSIANIPSSVLGGTAGTSSLSSALQVRWHCQGFMLSCEWKNFDPKVKFSSWIRMPFEKEKELRRIFFNSVQ